jgi:hypothetical protein
VKKQLILFHEEKSYLLVKFMFHKCIEQNYVDVCVLGFNAILHGVTT